jgi:hypothetical protein
MQIITTLDNPEGEKNGKPVNHRNSAQSILFFFSNHSHSHQKKTVTPPLHSNVPSAQLLQDIHDDSDARPVVGAKDPDCASK